MVLFDGVYFKRSLESTSFLRFYEDGVVIGVSSTGEPEQIASWFSSENENVSRGCFSTRGWRIAFSTISEQGTVSYSGEVRSARELILDSFSHINGHQATEQSYGFAEVRFPG